MKKLVVLVFIIFLVGCSNIKIEQNEEINKEKEDYLAIKNELNSVKEYVNDDDLPCDVTISIDRINKEEISYRAIIDNPKIDMYNVKALLIHDYFTEDIFPSIGIFDKTENLLIGNEEVKGISLVGYIETTKDIDELNLNIKLYIEYTDGEGNVKEIYYKLNNDKENTI